MFGRKVIKLRKNLEKDELLLFSQIHTAFNALAKNIDKMKYPGVALLDVLDNTGVTREVLKRKIKEDGLEACKQYVLDIWKDSVFYYNGTGGMLRKFISRPV